MTAFCPALDSAEINTYAARVALFTRRGFKERTAEAMADKLLARDRDEDDRRVCWECKHLRQGLICQARGAALRGVFQRCERFASAIETLPA